MRLFIGKAAVHPQDWFGPALLSLRVLGVLSVGVTLIAGLYFGLVYLIGNWVRPPADGPVAQALVPDAPGLSSNLFSNLPLAFQTAPLPRDGTSVEFAPVATHIHCEDL